MDKCYKHGLPFDEMGYCQPDEGLSCSGWGQMQDRIAELEEEVERLENYRCPHCGGKRPKHTCIFCTKDY